MIWCEKMFNYVKSFLNYLGLEKNYSEYTLISYEKDLTDFVVFLKESASICDIKEITYLEVRKYLAWLQAKGYSRTTIARKLTCLRSFFKYLCQRKFLQENPLKNITTPRREKKTPAFLFIEDARYLVEKPCAASPLAWRDRAILETLYAAGIRVGELVRLDLGDLNLTAGFIRVLGKGRKERIVPLGSKARKAIETYLTKGRPRLLKKLSLSEEALFLNKLGGRISARSIGRLVDKYSAELGLKQKVSPHVFRHTFATHLLDGG